MPFKNKIRKQGDDLAVQIPHHFAEEWGVKEGTQIELSVEGRVLRMRKRRKTLDEMNASIDPENIETDGPRGN